MFAVTCIRSNKRKPRRKPLYYLVKITIKVVLFSRKSVGPTNLIVPPNCAYDIRVKYIVYAFKRKSDCFGKLENDFRTEVRNNSVFRKS